MELNNKIKDLQNLVVYRKHLVWQPYMEKYKCDFICEIGVRHGANFDLMTRHNPKLAVAVDIWRNDGVMAHNDGAYLQEELDKQYLDFKKGIGNKPFVKIYREYSHNAVKRFPDNYFDFIYIDADHTYQSCLQDIKGWYSKVKKGGVLAGDDYREAKVKTGVRFGVIRAVETFIKENNLSCYELPRYNWVILK